MSDKLTSHQAWELGEASMKTGCLAAEEGLTDVASACVTAAGLYTLAAAVLTVSEGLDEERKRLRDKEET